MSEKLRGLSKSFNEMECALKNLREEINFASPLLCSMPKEECPNVTCWVQRVREKQMEEIEQKDAEIERLKEENKILSETPHTIEMDAKALWELYAEDDDANLTPAAIEFKRALKKVSGADEMQAEIERLKDHVLGLQDACSPDCDMVKLEVASRDAEIERLKEAIEIAIEAISDGKILNDWYKDESITWGTKISNLQNGVEAPTGGKGV